MISLPKDVYHNLKGLKVFRIKLKGFLLTKELSMNYQSDDRRHFKDCVQQFFSEVFIMLMI